MSEFLMQLNFYIDEGRPEITNTLTPGCSNAPSSAKYYYCKLRHSDLQDLELSGFVETGQDACVPEVKNKNPPITPNSPKTPLTAPLSSLAQFLIIIC